MFVNVAKVVNQVSLKVKLWLMFVIVAKVGIESSFKLWLMFIIVAKVGIESNFKLWLMFVIMPKGD